MAHSSEKSDLQNLNTLPDNPSTDEENLDLTPISTTEEERRGTIPQSTEATAMALAMSRATANPVVERSRPRKVKRTTTSKPVQHTAVQTDDSKSQSVSKTPK